MRDLWHCLFGCPSDRRVLKWEQAYCTGCQSFLNGAWGKGVPKWTQEWANDAKEFGLRWLN